MDMLVGMKNIEWNAELFQLDLITLSSWSKCSSEPHLSN